MKKKINGCVVFWTEPEEMFDAYVDAMKDETAGDTNFFIGVEKDGIRIAEREVEDYLHMKRTIAKLEREPTYFSDFLQRYKVN